MGYLWSIGRIIGLGHGASRHRAAEPFGYALVGSLLRGFPIALRSTPELAPEAPEGPILFSLSSRPKVGGSLVASAPDLGLILPPQRS